MTGSPRRAVLHCAVMCAATLVTLSGPLVLSPRPAHAQARDSRRPAGAPSASGQSGQRSQSGAPPGPAAASGNVQQDLDAAEKAYVDLEYDKANKLADAVIKQRNLGHDTLVRAYRLLARTHAVLDHDKEARDAFAMLLTYAPDEKDDKNLPPKVTDRQLEARGMLSGYGGKPGLEVLPELRGRARDASLLRVTTRDPTHIVRKVVVGYRWGSSGSFTSAPIASGELVAVDVSAPPPGVSRLDYYALALDDRDDAVFETGNALVPKTAMLDASSAGVTSGAAGGGGGEHKTIFASPIFWAIAGGIVLGASAGIYAATRPGTASSATLSPSIMCGGTRCL